MATDTQVRIRPLDDRVVIEIVDAEVTTKGGIVLPDTAQEKPQEGIIVAAGPGKLLEDGKRADLSVAEGDRVIFGKYSGSDVTVDGQEFKIMRESDILAKLS